MEKLMKYLIEKDSKYESLQLLSAKYFKQSNTLEVSFSCFEYDYDVEKLKQLVLSYIDNCSNVKINIKQEKLSKEYLEMRIKEYLFNDVAYSQAVDLERISVSEFNNNYQISLFVDKTKLNKLDNESLTSRIKQEISMLGNFEVDFNIDCYESQSSNIIENRKEIFAEDNAIDFSNIVRITNFKLFLGRIDDVFEAKLPININNTEKDAVIAGFIQNVSEFTSKKNIGTDKKYYKFDLVYDEERINCTTFSKDGFGLFELENNRQIVVLGDIDEYNGAFSIRVKGIGLCSFDLPKKVEKKASKFYKYVSPEPYVNIEQASFLDIKKQTESNYLLENDFVVFDLETTGIDYKNNKIIEIGAVKIRKGEIIEQFSTFVNPQMHINDEASKVNNIYDDMVASAPTYEQVIPDFFKFCENAILVGHNLIGFDLPFLNYYAKKIGYEFKNKAEDTMEMSRKYLGQLKHVKLSNVCDFLGVSLIGAHRAVNDTIATAKVFIKLIENYAKI